MEKLKRLILLSFLFIQSVNALDIRGYSIGQVVANKSSKKDYDHSLSALRVQNINRINAFNSFENGDSFEFGFEVNQSFDRAYDENYILDYESSTRPYRVASLTPTIIRSNRYSEKSYTNFLNIDRVMLNLNRGDLQVNIGRQPIYFGTSKTANPLDVLTPFSLTQINTEERQGVDAARVRYPIGIMGQLDAGLVFGESFDANKSSAFLNAKFNIQGYEFGPHLQRYSEASLFGLEAITDFFGANIYIEAGFSNPDHDKDYFRSTIGIESLVTPELNLSFEYHFNGAGGTSDNHYLDVNQFSVTKGGVTFLGEHYFNSYGYYQISGVDTVGALVYLNLIDASVLVAPSYIRSLSDNQELNIGAFFGLGKRTSSNIPESEFGSTDSSIYTKYKYFF